MEQITEWTITLIVEHVTLHKSKKVCSSCNISSNVANASKMCYSNMQQRRSSRLLRIRMHKIPHQNNLKNMHSFLHFSRAKEVINHL